MSWIVRQIWNYEIGDKTNGEVNLAFLSSRAELSVEQLVARNNLLNEIVTQHVCQKVDRANNQLHTCRQFVERADADKWLDFVTKTYDSFGGFTRVSGQVEEGDLSSSPLVSDL